MAQSIVGSYFGTVEEGVDLVPIFRNNELQRHPDSFLKMSGLVIKKIAIAAPSGTKFKINDTEFLMPSNSFELSYGMMDINKLVFSQETTVTIAYAY